MRDCDTKTIPRLASAMAANVLAVAIAASPAAAVDNPTEWVRGIYAKYAANQAGASALDVFKPEATDRLKKAIAAEVACAKRNNGMCGLDFDPIADAQDIEIKDVVVTSHSKTSTTQTGRGWVTAKFTNGGTPHVIEYVFVQVSERWLLDEVSNKSPGSDPWVLSKLLGKAD